MGLMTNILWPTVYDAVLLLNLVITNGSKQISQMCKRSVKDSQNWVPHICNHLTRQYVHVNISVRNIYDSDFVGTLKEQRSLESWRFCTHKPLIPLRCESCLTHLKQMKTNTMYNTRYLYKRFHLLAWLCTCVHTQQNTFELSCIINPRKK
jgi:hypothetical protein